MPNLGLPPRELASTDELIRWYDINTGLTRAELEAAIPAAIDALYTEFDGAALLAVRSPQIVRAGAAAAVKALQETRRAAYEASKLETSACTCGADGDSWHHPGCALKQKSTLDQVRDAYPPMDEQIALAEENARRVEGGDV